MVVSRYGGVALMVFFGRPRRLPAPRNRRRSRPAGPAIQPERLEPRLALSAAPAWVQNLFPKAETASAAFASELFSDSTVFQTKVSALVGNQAPWQVITSLPEGVKIEKWVEAKNPAWVDVTAFPRNFPLLDFTKQLALRAVKNSNTIRVTIDPTVVTGDVTALFKSFGGVRTMPSSNQAPTAVQNLAVNPTGVGELTLRWDAPATGEATSYSITMTTSSGTGPSTQYVMVNKRSATFSNLSPANAYFFSVTATNQNGSSAATNTNFGQSTLSVTDPIGLTTGLNGDIWATTVTGSTGSVRQIEFINGQWWAKQKVALGAVTPSALTTGLDGSIWAASQHNNFVQQLTNSAEG